MLLGAPSPDTVQVRVGLELEESWYGRPSDATSKILAFGALGVLGLAMTGGERVAGAVQWRARVDWDGHPAASEIVGRGLIVGKPAKLSRRDAILRANKRALYDVATQIAFLLNRECSLRLKKKVTSGSYSEFEETTDAW